MLIKIYAQVLVGKQNKVIINSDLISEIDVLIQDKSYEVRMASGNCYIINEETYKKLLGVIDKVTTQLI